MPYLVSEYHYGLYQDVVDQLPLQPVPSLPFFMTKSSRIQRKVQRCHLTIHRFFSNLFASLNVLGHQQEKEIAKKEREQVKQNRESAKKDREQAKIDRENAKKDREQAKKDRVEARKQKKADKGNKEQAKKDRVEARKRQRCVHVPTSQPWTGGINCDYLSCVTQVTKGSPGEGNAKS